MGFKLGSESRKIRTPENTKIVRTKLEGGTMAEANNDGSINVDSSIPVGSKKYKNTVSHELQHMNDMESGRAQYGDNWVNWEGKTYFRGNGMIDGPAGRLPEGHPNHPWEKSALKAEIN